MLITRKKEALKMSAGYIQERGMIQQSGFKIKSKQIKNTNSERIFTYVWKKGWVLRVKNMKGQTRENCA